MSKPDPSATLKLAKLLGVSTDDLLGIEAPKKGKAPDTRLQWRMQQIEKLPVKNRRQLMQLSIPI